VARLAIAALLVGVSVAAQAGERYALVVTGASGGERYEQKYAKWRQSLKTTLLDSFHYPSDHVVVLAEKAGPGADAATRANIQRVLGDFRKRLTKDDQLFVFLGGHGTSHDGPAGDDGKFNLVGPDLSATEWAELLKPIAGRVIVVDSTSGSFPFLHKLAASGAIVVTATDNAAQQFETVFPEYFVKAFEDDAADADRNGRVSIWEAFTYASNAVRQYFEQKGQLATERPLLDDTGAGVGREAQNPGTDGALARITYLEPEAPLNLPADSALAALMRRRAELENALEELKAKRESLTDEQYNLQLEKLLVEIARLSQQIKAKT
jgi:hypothetical protein